MIYCPQCGSKLRDGVNFCKFCGHKLKKTAPTGQARPPVQRTPQQPQQSQERSPTRRNTGLYDQAMHSNQGQPPSASAPLQKEPLKPGDLAETAPPLGEDLDELPQYAPVDEPEDAQGSIESEPDIAEEEPEEEFPSIPSDIIDVLVGRQRLKEIKQEEEAVIDDMSKIDQRLEIGLLDVDSARDQLDEKKNALQSLKAEKSSIPSETLPYEQLTDEIKEIELKIQKLETMRNEGKISRETVYKKLKNEYSEEYNKIKTQLDTETKRLTQWSRQLTEDVQNYQDHIELMATKAELGEITVQEAQEKRKEYQHEADRRRRANEVLRSLI